MKNANIKPEHYSFTRYLETKVDVDNRALNQQVWSKLSEELGKRETLRIVEVGAGIGTMVDRFLSASLFQQAAYTGLDVSPENISYARERLPSWAQKNGFQVTGTRTGCFLLERNSQKISVEFRAADVMDFVVHDGNWMNYDLLIAHAFMDLVDIPSILPGLFRLLDKKGLFYLTINYDGLTVLEPTIDDDLDRQVLKLYHERMDKRVRHALPSGDSLSGRHLFNHIRKAGGKILAAGSSDWVVFAGENGYTEDEAYFLHFIIHTISTALQNHPMLNLHAFEEWVNARHAQINSSELVYIAHQIDFLGHLS